MDSTLQCSQYFPEFIWKKTSEDRHTYETYRGYAGNEDIVVLIGIGEHEICTEVVVGDHCCFIYYEYEQPLFLENCLQKLRKHFEYQYAFNVFTTEKITEILGVIQYDGYI